MQPLQFLVPLGALEAVAGILPHVILVLVLANLVTRFVGHRRHLSEAADGNDEVSRFLPHSVTTVLLIVVSFAFMIVEPHGGMVMSVLVVGVFLTDFFEFEARNVEARNQMGMDRPNGSLVASMLLLLYAGYQSLFFVVEPVWSAII